MAERDTDQTLTVAPAKAGAHNHMEEFDEDKSFGTAVKTDRQITRYGFRPPVRNCALGRDDTGGEATTI